MHDAKGLHGVTRTSDIPTLEVMLTNVLYRLCRVQSVHADLFVNRVTLVLKSIESELIAPTLVAFMGRAVQMATNGDKSGLASDITIGRHVMGSNAVMSHDLIHELPLINIIEERALIPLRHIFKSVQSLLFCWCNHFLASLWIFVFLFLTIENLKKYKYIQISN